MKKLIIFGLLFFSISSVASTSADKLDPLLGLYMTDKQSTEPRTVFDWNDIPYAFMRFDINDLNTDKPLTLWWKWKYENGKYDSFEWTIIDNFFPENHLDIWYSPFEWGDIKKAGEWHVMTTWRNSGGGGGMSKTRFTVTPEPISHVLFIIGGIVLLIRKKINRTR